MKTISSFFLISLTLLALLTGWAHAGSVEKIYTLPAEKIAGHIIKQPGRKVVFIYATWCPYCREKIPALIELESAKPGSVYPVSIDESSNALGIYLSQYPVVPFLVLRLQDHKSKALESIFSAPPRSGIPYAILLDEENKLHEVGNFNAEYISKYVMGE